MIKTGVSLKSELIDFWEMHSNRWDFANSILYDMCAKNPLHDDANVIVGKLWLIGRSYAAAIERRKNISVSNRDEDFYYDTVAPKMLSIGKELDERISKLKDASVLCDCHLDCVLSTHKFLMDAFYEITDLEKRSLASKYLHFHCPSMFYIYDSRASQAIRKKVTLDKQRASAHYPCGCDVEYANFCVRMLELQEFCEKQFGKTLMPRELDDFLLQQ